jgi:hypothetical protein
MPLDLSVVVTAYNSAAVLPRLLDSIAALPAGESPAETIVVDNASADGTADVVAADYPGARLIRNRRNLGLSRANNAGAAEACGSHLLFLNPDVRVLPGSLPVLMDAAEGEAEAALLGPAMRDAGGRPQSTARSFPTLLDIALRRTPLGSTRWGRRRLRGHLFPVDGSGTVDVDWLVGAAMWLTPKGRSRVGLMSPRFFLYFEDVEWCWRARACGMRVLYVPGASMEHVPRRESASGAGRVLWHHLWSMVKFYAAHPACAVGLGRPGVRGSACR